MVEIIESNMHFGEFDEKQVFQIENSELYRNMGKGIRVVEFITVRDDKKLEFIEAKSSSPKPLKDNSDRFDEYIDEICSKFIDSFNLYYSSILKRNKGYYEMSDQFLKLDNSVVKFIFILVIKEHKKEWLMPINEAIKKRMIKHSSIWKSTIAVLNEEGAKKRGLII